MKAASARIHKRHARVLDELETCLALAREPAVLELRSPAVSDWSVAQHLEHMGLVDRSVLGILEKPPDEPTSGRGLTPMGRLLLFLGFIPRGRATAPSFVEPGDPTREDVGPKLTEIRDRFRALGEDLARLDGGVPLGEHPVFGHLDGAQWLRFASIHHRHHLKIIRDVRR